MKYCLVTLSRPSYQSFSMSTLFPDGISVGWLGHAFFEVTGPKGLRLGIDPFYASNPAFPRSELPRITAPGAFHYLLITHPHSDHFEGVVPLLKGDPQLKAICQFEIANLIASQGVPAEQVVGMNTGGTLPIEGARITMVQAIHTSSYSENGKNVALGSPCGYVIRFANGFTLYNSGDTAVTLDMQIVHDLYRPDLVILPIGDFYTMGAEQAAYALKLLRPKFALGGHYDTWGGMPPGRPQGWEEELKKYPEVSTQILKLKPGQQVT